MKIDFSEAWFSVEQMVQGLIERLPHIVLALVVFLVFYLVAKGVRHLVRRFALQRKRHRNLALVLGRTAQAVIAFLGLMVALVIVLPTFKPGQLLELLGITGVAIGFAFRDVLQNFLAGILLLITEPFRIDDQIRVENYEGTVEDIQTRATTIRTYDGRRVVIPNSDLFTKSVVVNTAYQARRLEYEVGIGYGDDVDRAKHIILEALRQVESVLPDPAPDVLVAGLAPSSVTLRVRWWILPPRRADALDALDRVVAEVKKALLANGIDLPFPIQQVLFHDQTEETDGERAHQREGWPAGQDKTPKSRSIAGALKEIAAHLANGQPRSYAQEKQFH